MHLINFTTSTVVAVINLTRNAWQSLAYSPLGAVVSPHSEYLWKTLTYWSPECLTPHPIANIGELSLVTIIDSDHTVCLPKTLEWLIQISPNFHKLYRTNCQLSCWNQNCDIPIRFRTTVCQMNENRPISAESQHNFHFLPHFNSKAIESIFTIFTRCRAISRAINACICKTILHFVSEHKSKERRRQFWRLQNSPKINWLP